MAQYCDLHTHSTYSDGTLSPTELIGLAKSKGLCAVALCDHNTIAGLPEFIHAGEELGIQAIGGVEFSTEYRGSELHILGLFIRPEHYDPITKKLAEMLKRKEQANRALIEALKLDGIDLDYDTIHANAPGQINRAVIGAEMVRKGYCESVKEAFAKWLSPRRGYYHPPQRLDALEAIRFIKSLGAVAVLAHPLLSLNEQELRPFLEKAKPAGLDGMEVYYSTYSPEETSLAIRIAADYSLAHSGGSDFHGGNKPDISLGTGKDNLRIGDNVLKNLEKNKDFYGIFRGL